MKRQRWERAAAIVSAFALLTAVCWSAVAGDRSGQWHAVRDAYVAKHPTCEACGAEQTKQKPLEVHHVKPVHLWPESELDPGNLITLCDRCHLLIGHLGDFKAFNPLAREDAARQLARIKARPYTREAAEAYRQRFGAVANVQSYANAGQLMARIKQDVAELPETAADALAIAADPDFPSDKSNAAWQAVAAKARETRFRAELQARWAASEMRWMTLQLRDRFPGTQERGGRIWVAGSIWIGLHPDLTTRKWRIVDHDAILLDAGTREQVVSKLLQSK